MNGFIDIHTHILPELDDGARDVSEALNMVRMAWEDGTGALVLTPHCCGHFPQNSTERICEAFERFRLLAAKEFPEMELYLGAEIRYESEVPEKLEAGQLRTLNGSCYVLLEFSSRCPRNQILSGISNCIYSGFTPVIAHVERIDAFCRDVSLVEEAVDLGALIQVNAAGILGEQGLKTRFFCRRLLRNGLIHFVASDCHHADRRMPQLKKCWEKISKKYGEEYARRVFCENARAVIENAEI